MAAQVAAIMSNAEMWAHFPREEAHRRVTLLLFQLFRSMSALQTGFWVSRDREALVAATLAGHLDHDAARKRIAKSLKRDRFARGRSRQLVIPPPRNALAATVQT